MSIHQVIIDPIYFLHVEQLVAVRMLIVSPDRSELLDHLKICFVNVFGAWNGLVWVFHLVLTLLHGFLIRVQLEVVNEIVNSIDLFAVKHDWLNLILNALA